MDKNKLNVDFSDSITRLRALIKEFPLTRNINKFIFKGKGLEFEGYKDYIPDEDDAATIDWKASARANKLLSRKYIEEREVKSVFIIDCGSNMVFGSTKKLKCEYSAEIAAALSRLLFDINDWIGFILFSDKIKSYYPPRPGEDQFRTFIDELMKPENYGGYSNLDSALDFTINYLGKDVSSLIIISDFINLDSNVERKFSFLRGLFKDVLVIRVLDPLDQTLPDVEEEYIIESPSGDRQMLVNPAIAKRTYEKFAKDESLRVRKIFEKNGIDFLDLNTSIPFHVPVSIFLKQRMGKIL
jgi:uncharacterized protein (DUF58 family)